MQPTLPKPHRHALAKLSKMLTLVAGRWRIAGEAARYVRGESEAATVPAVIEIDVPAKAIKPILRATKQHVVQPLRLRRNACFSGRSATLLIDGMPVILRDVSSLRVFDEQARCYRWAPPLTQTETLTVSGVGLPFLRPNESPRRRRLAA